MSLSQDCALNFVNDNMLLDIPYYSDCDSDRDIDLQDTYYRLFTKFSELRVINANYLKNLRVVENDRNLLSDKLNGSCEKCSALKSENLMLSDRVRSLEKRLVESSSSKNLHDSIHNEFVDNLDASSSHVNHSSLGPRNRSNSKFIPTCHHCRVIGHICPHCFHLRPKGSKTKENDFKMHESDIMKRLMVLSDQVKEVNEKLVDVSNASCQGSPVICTESLQKEMFVKKEDDSCLVFHIALNVINSCLWYLASACSKHMTGNKALFKELKEGRGGGNITYGDVSKSKVFGKGVVEIPGVPTLEEVLYVDGLKANLLSISQFCDDDLVVQFSKKECNIFENSDTWIIGGERTADNCYGLSANPRLKCSKATLDTSSLWRQRLWHLNYHDLCKLSKRDAIADLPKLDKVDHVICGLCQIGKQTRAAHKKTPGIHTFKILELIHMDLMGPTRTESMGGKKYILVIVDDFSRYTWGNFVEKKSDAFDLRTCSKRFKMNKEVPSFE